MSGKPSHHPINPDRRYGSPPKSSVYVFLIESGSLAPLQIWLLCKKKDKQINLVSFHMKLPAHNCIHPVFHVSHLIPYHSPVSPPSPEPGTIDEPPYRGQRSLHSERDLGHPALMWSIEVPRRVGGVWSRGAFQGS